MTNEDILYGNKVIAEFMGISEAVERTEKLGGGGYLGCSYHMSWNWLMPVVTKINKWHISIRPFVYGNPESVRLKILEDRVTIEAMFWPSRDVNKGSWVYLKKKKFLYSKFSELEATWRAVVVFVEWYNKVKNETNN